MLSGAAHCFFGRECFQVARPLERAHPLHLAWIDARLIDPRAYTVNYTLSDIEAALYEAVTSYVQREMGKADELEGARKGAVGFALTTLQRRLASSPEAIYQSLRRRKERLESRLRDEKLGIRGRAALAETLAGVPEDDDDLDAACGPSDRSEA
jgi:hypothetical protein